MKYLICLRLSKQLNNLILSQKGVIIPRMGFHVTLCVFHMNSAYEKQLLHDLSSIVFNPFTLETLDFDFFDDDSLVLRLSCPQDLLNLHNNIVNLVRKYADQDFDTIAAQYYGDKYNPHITISSTSGGFEISSNALLGKKEIITQYITMKKGEENWENIQQYDQKSK